MKKKYRVKIELSYNELSLKDLCRIAREENVLVSAQGDNGYKL